jgi:selenide,water dikinase
MGPGDLAQVLRPLAQHSHPNLIIGLNPGDDAAVYRIGPSQALVQTLDFFPPIVDDPYTFGAIAAANSMSDVYAMGGEVMLALNIVAFPEDLDKAVLTAILQGGMDKVREAGGIIAGGHTVTDREPKYGLCVTGMVDPAQIMSKSGARPGDRLILTKPVGTGVVTTAAKNDRAQPAHLQGAVDSMLRLNGPAARVLRWAGVRACTDITGFGLLGHASEMAQASGARLRISASAVPFLDGALECVKDKQVPGGTGRNRDYLLSPTSPEQARVTIEKSISRDLTTLLFDPQTSGGLFAAIPSDKLPDVRSALKEQDVECWEVGEVVEGESMVEVE